jgi:hypothetical protein
MCLEKQFPPITTYPFCNGVQLAPPRERNLGGCGTSSVCYARIILPYGFCLQAGWPFSLFCMREFLLTAPFFLFGSALSLCVVDLDPWWAVVAMQRERTKNHSRITNKRPANHCFGAFFACLLWECDA